MKRVFLIIILIIVGVVLIGYFTGFNFRETEKEKCLKAGGKWGVWAYMVVDAKPSCNLPTSDDGKECTDNEQCENFCEAPENSNEGDEVVGKCYGFRFNPACSRIVINGKYEGEVCV